MSHDVIVCVHNGGRDVVICLDSILRHWDENYQKNLIVVDDFSSDEMGSYLFKLSEKDSRVTLVRLNEQNYYTKAANIGLLNSSAHYRTLLNSDTIVTKGWIQKIEKVFSISPEVGIVGPLSNAASTQSVPFVKSSANQTAINLLPPGVSIDFFADFVEKKSEGIMRPFTPLIHGFCLSLSSSVIEKIGLFDEVLFPRGYGEENDYCFRAEDEGFILAIALDTFIYHAKSKSYISSERETFMRNGMKNFTERYGAARIGSAIAYMEGHPSLRAMRHAVHDAWSSFYGQAS